MPRPLSIALIATLCLASTARAEDKPSPAVKRILDKAVAEVRKNREEFSKANAKPLGDARRDLQELVAKLNKDGKTKEAIDTLKQVETLEADVLKLANAPAPVPVVGRPALQKPLLERLEGRWDRSNSDSYWTISRDGTAGCRRFSDNSPCHGDAKAIIVDEETAEIAWPQGWKWLIRMAGNDVLAVQETGPDGKVFGDGLILMRQK